ncbi:hypothetical protein [Calothrix sp. PCC 6303]|uniref:hypothetical protein n=1 Tax=Calothrix sp. PCC 6303 TaxID=1170562 RepID=UPI0002A00A9B|nr:hypothetical protein [Calothrix sp. PCC 6303]AFZ04604.1 hypothetical protein Cal6303_5737 [Calothrix sp. PCC 6303]
MSESIYNLQQLASLYRHASVVNKQREYTNRQEAQKCADSAIENPQYENDCRNQEQEYLRMAATWEQIAAIQLEYALICENPVNEYQHILSDLEILLNKIRHCREVQCSNEACREILELIQTYCLKDSLLYDNYPQYCGHIN